MAGKPAAGTNAVREIVLVLIVGLIGLGGAYIGSCATVVTQRDQARETRQAEARIKRAATYSSFLRAAGAYVKADLTVGTKIKRPPKDLCRPSTREACRSLVAASRRFLRDRIRFGNALDQVFIYGSSPGVRAARRLAETLPSTANDETGSIKQYKPTTGDFPDAYAAMLSVTCNEASAEPRHDCSKRPRASFFNP